MIVSFNHHQIHNLRIQNQFKLYLAKLNITNFRQKIFRIM